MSSSEGGVGAAARREARIGRPHAPPPDVEASAPPVARALDRVAFCVSAVGALLFAASVFREVRRVARFAGGASSGVVDRSLLAPPRLFRFVVASLPGGAAAALGVGSSTRLAPASSFVRAALYAPTTASSA